MAAFEQKRIDELRMGKKDFFNWVKNNVPGGILDDWDYDTNMDPQWFFAQDPEDSTYIVIRKLKQDV